MLIYGLHSRYRPNTYAQSSAQSSAQWYFRWYCLALFALTSLGAQDVDVDEWARRLASDSPRAVATALNRANQELSYPDRIALAQRVGQTRNVTVGTWATATRQPMEMTPQAMERWLGVKMAQPHIAQWLPRHNVPALASQATALLTHRDPVVRRAALSYWVGTGGADAAQLRSLKQGQRDKDPACRAVLAEWYRRYGTVADARFVQSWLAKESSPYVLAVLHNAVQTLREQPLAATAPRFVHYWYTGGQDHRLFLKNIADRKNVIDQFNQQHAVEHVSVDPQLDAEWIFPVLTGGSVPEESFGISGAGPFAGLIHVGSDVAWMMDLQPVLSPSAGVVKLATPYSDNWGGLMVIEHQTDAGPVCSLHAHLDHVMLVEPGQQLATGQQIGCLGPSYTLGNGGYVTHLHLGLYQGAYGNGEWVTGYVPSLDQDPNWIDPIAFFAERGVHPQ